jgi:hypothetical protein
MALDAHKNFAASNVAAAPSPADSGVSLTVVTGEGTRFPAAPFNAVVCPANANPTPANAEVVRVTVIATDVFTITRAQEGSSARTITVGDRIYAAQTAKTFTDIETLFPFYDRDLGLPGAIAPMPVLGAAASTQSANQARFGRFIPSRDMTIALIALVVSTAAIANDACDVGIYDAAGNRLVSAGATTGKLNALGVQTLAITPTALTKNTVYYAGFSYGTAGGAAAALQCANFGGSGHALFGGAIPKLLAGFLSTSHPLPTTISGLSVLTNVPIMALRES